MADQIPLKLVDVGGGKGRLQRFEAGDTIPVSRVPGAVPLAGGVTMTGHLEVPAGATGAQAIRAEEARWTTPQGAGMTGTAFDITSIPNWVNEITLGLVGVVVPVASNAMIRLGTAGGVLSSGYQVTASTIYSGSLASVSASTSGFSIASDQSINNSIFGEVRLFRISSTGWAVTSILRDAAARQMFIGGSVELGDTLTTIRFLNSAGLNFLGGVLTWSWRR